MIDVSAAAERLDNAALEARAIAQFGDELDLATAYRVQAALIGRRLARGERRIGVKMGFTSKAKMAQMGVDDLIWGQLTDAMQVEDGGTLSLARFIHPRVEPELAFRLGRRLVGKVSLREARAAVTAVAPAMEIIDSRFADFRFSLADVVADNSSAAAFVIGPWLSNVGNLSDIPMTLRFDDRVVQVGSSTAILGDPLEALVAAARLVEEAGGTLEPGDIVLAGAATAAEPLRPGVLVCISADGLASASFRTAAGGSA